MSEYHYGRAITHYHFCRHCGIIPFGRGVTDDGEFFAVNLACLEDNALTDLATAPIRYEDGKHDNWDTRPAEVHHL